MPFDIFAGDSGLKEDYDGTITSALFVQNDAGKYVMQMTITADDGEEPTLRLGIGNNWSSYDAGETVSGPTATTKFNNRTAYQKFIAAAMKAGAGDEMRRRNETVYNGLGPCYASFWVGMKFHFDIVMDLEAQTRDDETGEWKKVEGGRPVVTPTKFLGSEEVKANGNQPSLMDAADEVKLSEAAMSSATFQEFAQAVMGLEDSSGQPMAKNKTVMSKLANQSWFEELKGAVSA